MAVTRTFSIIKPDATRRNLTGAVTKMLEDAGLRVIASKRIRMTRDHAEGFYAVHRERPFFNDLCTFMTSGPVVVQVLEGEDAVKLNRDVMGATNPADAAEGTIRKTYAESIEANSVHGSDSDENAGTEIAFFFKPEEIVGKIVRGTSRPMIVGILGKLSGRPGSLPIVGRSPRSPAPSQ